MNLKIILCCVIFSFSIARANDSSKLFSMNLHCGIDNWEFRVNTILDKVVELDPNVVSFQEVCVNTSIDMISFIKKGLRDRGFNFKTSEELFTHRAWGKYNEYLMILSKKKAKGVTKEDLPWSPLPRGYIALKVGGIWYVNVHLEHRADYYKYREEQIDFLIQKFSAYPHILMGDFNSSPRDKEQSKLHDKKYKHYFPSLTHPQPQPVRAIDGFWISNRVYAQQVYSESLFKDSIRGIFMSDHLGVLLKGHW